MKATLRVLKSFIVYKFSFEGSMIKYHTLLFVADVISQRVVLFLGCV